MQLIAHRGFAGEAPENTPSAFRRAAKRGADAVEFDVRRCGSGDPVVIHDATVDRVTGASGRVADLGREELAAMDVLGSGEGVPTLAAALDAIPPDVAVNAEFKEPVADVALPPLDDAPNRVLVSSFDPDVLATVAERDSDVETAFLSLPDDDPIALASELGCTAVHPEVDLALARGFVERARDRGLTVNAWTVEDRGTADRLRTAGVDGVVADYADVL